MSSDAGVRPTDHSTLHTSLAPPAWDTAPTVVPSREPCPLETAPPGGLDLGPHYLDEGLLGSGGSAVVRQARDLRLGRPVALKIMRATAAASPELRARFEVEARLVARLDHPGVATVLEAGQLQQLNQRPYQALRIVRGHTLGHEFATPVRTARERTVTFRARAEMVLRVAETIAHMHAHDVVHRDLKPANCMVGQHREVVVLDLGMAAFPGAVQAELPAISTTDPLITLYGRISGTPAFMAPEQARGHKTGPHTDIHALGVLLHCAWAGMPSVGTRSQTLVAAAAGQLFDRTCLADAPDDIRALITAALSPDPAQRPPTARAFAQRLGHWLDGSVQVVRATSRVRASERAHRELQQLLSQANTTDARRTTLKHHLGPRPALSHMTELWDLESRASRLRRQAARVRARRDTLLQEALTLSPDHPTARQRIADHAVAAHQAAVHRGDEQAAAAALWCLERQDVDHRHAHYRSGQGAWQVHTSAPVRIEVKPLLEKDRRLIPGDTGARTSGTVTEWAVRLPIGPWQARLHTEDGRVITVPFVVRREEQPAPFIHIPGPDTIPPDFAYIPAGAFWSGGDPGAYGEVQTDGVHQTLDGFAIARHPVTIGEWIEFLDHLLHTVGPEVALDHTPGPQSVEARVRQPMLIRLASGGTHFEPISSHATSNTPVVLVDMASTRAFIAWRSAHDLREYRLPYELEVERAARGADRRLFPWGDTYHPSFAATSASFSSDPGYPPSVNAFPLDVSPYNVHGLGGGVSTRCEDPYAASGPTRRGDTWSVARGEPDTCVAKGGTYVSGTGKSRISSRVRASHGLRAYSLGLRLCMSVGPTKHRS